MHQVKNRLPLQVPCQNDRQDFVYNSKVQDRFSISESSLDNMGVQKRTRKFAQVKRVIGQRDARLYVALDPPSALRRC